MGMELRIEENQNRYNSQGKTLKRGAQKQRARDQQRLRSHSAHACEETLQGTEKNHLKGLEISVYRVHGRKARNSARQTGNLSAPHSGCQEEYREVLCISSENIKP